MSASRIARRKISAEKQAAAANSNVTNLNNELDEQDYDTKMKSIDVKSCMDRVDGNLSPASIRRRSTRSKSVQNSEAVSRDLLINLPRKQLRSASDSHLSLDVSLQRRMASLSVTSDDTFDESVEALDDVSSDGSQLEDLISPRSWSDMIASDTAIISDDKQGNDLQLNSNNNNNNNKSNIKLTVTSDKSCLENEFFEKVYVEDVTFHDVNSNQRIKSFEPKEELITPRTWDEMVAEDSSSRDHNEEDDHSSTNPGVHRNVPTHEATGKPDPFAASIEFAWPNELPSCPSNGSLSPSRRERETSNDIRLDMLEESRNESLECEPGLRAARLDWNIRMLKRDLMVMRKTDQQIFRQLLSNYETIGQVSDHVTVTTETPSPLPPSPYPATPRSTPNSPEKRRSYSTTPGDNELLRIIREALDHPGSLNIGSIVTQLSPIRRRRSSEPTTMEYEELPPNFGEEDDDQELEDLLSLSCPVFKEPKAPTKAQGRYETKL